ncbi:c-type cytochrome [Kaarinaea lacus]
MKPIIAVLLLLSLLLPACEQKKEPSPEEIAEKAAAEQQAAADPVLGEQVAQACVECHPASGKIVNPEYPQINGLSQSYLSKSLLDYLSKVRTHEEMNQAIAELDHAQILNVAAYYASLTTPWTTSIKVTRKKTSKPSQKDIEAGKKLAGPCISCHGENGNSATEGVPSLSGLSVKYIDTALNGYFKGDRTNEFMKVFKHAFDKDRIAKLGAYFSSQKRIPSTFPVKGNARAGGKIANLRCIGCHGEGGNSFMEEFPSLAGQNYKFLYEATLSYNNGKRKNRIMQNAIKGLSKADIKNLSAYYATQKPAAVTMAAKEDAGDPAQAAASAAKSCFGCHGKDGNSTIAGNPNLSGFTPEQLTAAITQYQTGDRKHELMKSFVSRLDAEQVELISIHYASQEPKPTQNPGKGNPDSVKDMVGGCEGCHGAKGVSSSKTPSLAGQDAAYLVSALLNYQNKSRSNSDMQNAVAELSKDNFNNLATYFASQTPVKPEVNPLQTAQQLAEKCDRCHKTPEQNPKLPTPRIAGQSEAYLLKAINDYKTKARDQSTMFAMLDVLTNWEIAQIANYYARLNSSEK